MLHCDRPCDDGFQTEGSSVANVRRVAKVANGNAKALLLGVAGCDVYGPELGQALAAFGKDFRPLLLICSVAADHDSPIPNSELTRKCSMSTSTG